MMVTSVWTACRSVVASALQRRSAIADLAGRDDLVRLLVALLAPAAPAEAVRIVVITGRGGVGKSALAVHLAHQISDQFPDGQWFADLRGAGQSPADIGR